MPFLRAKREVFEWLQQGKKTIDIRKGRPSQGDVAFFQSGPNRDLQLRIIKKESGRLLDLVRHDNFKQIIPCAETLEDAICYLRQLFGDYNGVFTAYHVSTDKFDNLRFT